MNRQFAALTALGVVLLLVLYWLFLWSPKTDEVATIEEEIVAVEGQQATTTTRIRALEDVRARAPEIEASLAATESIIPRETALPAALRQLVTAADDSGLTIRSVSPGEPASVGEEAAEVSAIGLSLQAEGSYFQVVDFLRRISDPAITPRAILWTTMSLAPSDYPTLTVSLSGEMYAILPTPAAPAPEEPADGDVEEPADGDVEEPADEATETETEEEE